MTTLHDFQVTTLHGHDTSLSEYAGKVVLVVNTASKCGLTPQFEGLQQLYTKFQDEGLVVLGFPCNQFAAQEPGNADEISEFCQINYGVTFPMFAKIDVNGPDAHPLYRWLCGKHEGVLADAIQWNFAKFLIGKDGTVLRRYAPTEWPGDLADDIKEALGVSA